MAVMASAGPRRAREKSERVEKLGETRVIQSVPCAGYARFDAEGRLLSCILSEEHAFGRVVLPANTQIRRFHPDGSPKDVHLGREASSRRPPSAARVPADGWPGSRPRTPEYGFLVERETIDGVPCERGTFWGEITGGVIVRFHPDGRLKTPPRGRREDRGPHLPQGGADLAGPAGGTHGRAHPAVAALAIAAPDQQRQHRHVEPPRHRGDRRHRNRAGRLRRSPAA